MGMDWLRGLVGSSDQMIPAGQPIAPGWQPYGAPPGAAPPYGQPGAPAYAQPGAPPYAQPAQGGVIPGTPPPAWGAPPGIAPPGVDPQAGAQGGDPRIAALAAECAELRRDVNSIALFAKTLLALLEEKQICTEQTFQAAKLRLDMQDGKADDR